MLMLSISRCDTEAMPTWDVARISANSASRLGRGQRLRIRQPLRHAAEIEHHGGRHHRPRERPPPDLVKAGDAAVALRPRGLFALKAEAGIRRGESGRSWAANEGRSDLSSLRAAEALAAASSRGVSRVVSRGGACVPTSPSFPAQAGTQNRRRCRDQQSPCFWIPAFAGVTALDAPGREPSRVWTSAVGSAIR